ncbi:hypothetical protein NU219Hw_g4551t1 [Hortaea werneckii]
MDAARHLSRWFKDDTLVTILLSEDGTKYSLPKNMVCDISDYFSKALEGVFKEARERTLKLPDCSAETFDVLLYFHMYDRLPADLDSEDEAQLLLVNLWLFGDIHLIPRLRAKAFVAVSEILDHQPPCPAALGTILASGPENSELRPLFIQKATSSIFEGVYAEEQRAELAEIEGFFKVMADWLAAGKSSWDSIAGTAAQKQRSNSRSPTNSKAPDRTYVESTAPTTPTTVHPTSMPTSTPAQPGSPAPALNPAASANMGRLAKKQEFQRIIARNALLIHKQDPGR